MVNCLPAAQGPLATRNHYLLCSGSQPWDGTVETVTSYMSGHNHCSNPGPLLATVILQLFLLLTCWILQRVMSLVIKEEIGLLWNRVFTGQIGSILISRMVLLMIQQGIRMI